MGEDIDAGQDDPTIEDHDDPSIPNEDPYELPEELIGMMLASLPNGEGRYQILLERLVYLTRELPSDWHFNLCALAASFIELDTQAIFAQYQQAEQKLDRQQYGPDILQSVRELAERLSDAGIARHLNDVLKIKPPRSDVWTRDNVAKLRKRFGIKRPASDK